MALAGRIILEIAAVLVALGGLYDLFVPGLPKNLHAICGQDERVQKLVRELLRALGCALAVIGIVCLYLIGASGSDLPARTIALVLILIVPTELTNAFCMHRVKSPFYVPLAFVVIALLGAALVRI